ncbi:MAG: adenylate/guanylate cyclase domain-containing protein [Candidatus Baltobacteraceae bacterium]
MIRNGPSSRKRQAASSTATTKGCSTPTGTVVFMFSDIEGSTARWEANREAMQAALRRHDAILHAVVAESDGHVFKTVGDQFCAAFHTSQRAVSAAIELQRKLAAEDFAEVDGLRVRVAIHAGETDERAGDYYGPAVNRVARLLSTAHGGQVLVSGTVSDLVSAHLPADAKLVDLGWHRLKDLEQPEHVFQLAAPGIQAEFEPIRSLSVTANNLPQPTTSFVGREDDLREVDTLVRTGRLVSLIGVGGVGKTRLALQAGTNLLSEFRDGAWFVNFAPVTDPSLVASTILSALGVKAGGDASANDALIAHCRDRRLLLILDNCEHLISDIAHTANELLRAAPNVKVLATTREALNIAGEQAFRLPSLSIAEATRLFIDRASAAKASFAVTDENIATIEEICTRLDGIALAIELAAPRVKMLSLDDLNKRLNERFRVLTGGNRTALPRQQTMHALIDWSHDLLSASEKILFRRLGAFAGTFSFEGAAAVCIDEQIDECDILDLLAALVDKSLVVADVGDENSRYHLLQSIQAYACERIAESGEAAMLRRLHVAFYDTFTAASYREWDTTLAPNWLAHGKAELDDIRVALNWALAEGNAREVGASIIANGYPIFLRLSLLHEAIRWCEAALPVKSGQTIEARLHYGLSMLYNNQASISKALVAAESAVELYRSSSDSRGLTRALSQLAQQLRHQDRFEDALAVAGEALTHARSADDSRLLAATLQRCAMAFPPEQIDTARAQFEEAVRLFKELRRDGETARALAWWAVAEQVAGCFERAIELSLEALALETGDAKLYLEFNVAATALLAHRATLAREHAHIAMAMSRETKHPVVFPLSACYIGVAAAPSEPRAAAGLLGFARAHFDTASWPPEAHTTPAIFTWLDTMLRANLSDAEIEACAAEGSRWSDEEAFARAAVL